MQNFALLRGQTITLQAAAVDDLENPSSPVDAVPLTWTPDPNTPINVFVQADSTKCSFQGQTSAPAGTYNVAIGYVVGGIARTTVFSITIPPKSVDHLKLTQL